MARALIQAAPLFILLADQCLDMALIGFNFHMLIVGARYDRSFKIPRNFLVYFAMWQPAYSVLALLPALYKHYLLSLSLESSRSGQDPLGRTMTKEQVQSCLSQDVRIASMLLDRRLENKRESEVLKSRRYVTARPRNE